MAHVRDVVVLHHAKACIFAVRVLHHLRVVHFRLATFVGESVALCCSSHEVLDRGQARLSTSSAIVRNGLIFAASGSDQRNLSTVVVASDRYLFRVALVLETILVVGATGRGESCESG